jgi:hypothetical protein
VTKWVWRHGDLKEYDAKKIENKKKNYNFVNFYPIFKILKPAESWQQSQSFCSYAIFVYLTHVCHFQMFLE